jgi:hypothetical protein
MDAQSISYVIARDMDSASPSEAWAYLGGATRDATFNRGHKTWRFAQASHAWIRLLGRLINHVGHRSWTYEEGDRGVFVVETTCSVEPWPELRTRGELAAFARGYFDAEGGIPRHPSARFYIQLVQKDWEDLTALRHVIESLGIECGLVHNPSVRVDPEYWRFYIRSQAHQQFIDEIGSWHPRKREVLDLRKPPVRGSGR